MSIEAELTKVLSDTGPRIVAVSGGVDSLTLATFAHRAASRLTRIAHGVSPSVPPQATARVHDLARQEGWALTVLNPGEFNDKDYVDNPPNRCYFCKGHLYRRLAAKLSGVILSGANVDDLGDYRPGLLAAAELHVRHPLIEAGIDKAGVRRLAAGLGLGNIADIPASPCLSSRIQSYIRIDPADLASINAAERLIREITSAQNVRCRIRHDAIAVEMDAEVAARLTRAERDEVTGVIERAFKNRPDRPFAGIETYRMGSAFLRRAENAR